LVDPVRKEGEKTNRLTITKKERNDLIAQIDETFGKEIARGPQKNRTVAYNCAALIRAGLKKPYGVSD
jgi:hypothetical protein